MTNDEKEMAQSIIRDHQNRIIELEKENAELKKSLENCEGEIRTLYASNQRLNQMIEVKDKSSIDYINKIAELKAQIEKMKRPQNCKHSGSDYCMTNGYCVCDKWELAE